jgi:hypothetical protein
MCIGVHVLQRPRIADLVIGQQLDEVAYAVLWYRGGTGNVRPTEARRWRVLSEERGCWHCRMHACAVVDAYLQGSQLAA